MYEWSTSVIELADRKGIKVDLIGPEVRRTEIDSRIVKLYPDFVFLNGHGDCETFYGYENEPVIDSSNVHVLKDKIVFSRACNCADILGEEAVKDQGCTAFIGYKYEFVNVRRTTTEIHPLEDEVSRPIWEVSNMVPQSLIKGSNVKKAIESAHRKAEKEMFRSLLSKELHAVQVLKALLVNDDGLIFHGDSSATL